MAPFTGDEDWIFASPFTGGRKPYLGRGVQQRYLRKLGEELGMKRFGWHTFRHTYRALLGDTKAPMDVQKELMRHSSIITTIDTYGQALFESKRKANSEEVKLVIG